MGAIIRSLVMVVTLSIFTGLVYPLAMTGLAWRLHAWGWPLIDAQVPNAHTRHLGVEIWSRATYLAALANLREHPDQPGLWRERFGEWNATEVLPSPGLPSA